MPKIPLPGCTPEPLMNYLKALGVLRLVAEDEKNGDSLARGEWKEGAFVLHSRLNHEDLIAFFENHYAPSPILAPWGARSGFFGASTGKKTDSERKAREALDTICKQTASRFRGFRDAVVKVRDLLKELGVTAKAKDEDKLSLLFECRARLPEEMLQWLDACYVLTMDQRKFPPLFGTGGNEGSGSYVSGFAQQIVACLVERAYDAALAVALYGGCAARTFSDQTPGHFSPPAAGGANATQGFEGKVTTNPWDYLLAIEGACLWASGVVRRFGRSGKGMAAFPFTVNVTGVGATSLAETDGRRPKTAKRDVAEMWLPVWERLLSVAEISALLREGRATIGSRPAENGTDFARAATGLGVDRGIRAFHRIAFLMRNGQNFMAVSLGRITVESRRYVDILKEIDPWLARFRQACTDKAPVRLTRSLRAIDRAVFEHCSGGSVSSFGDILTALGAAERVLAASPTFRGKSSAVSPLQNLSSAWVAAADDGSEEFEIALALAAVGNDFRRSDSIRSNLEPVFRDKQMWQWATRSSAVVWSARDLAGNLSAVISRRVMDSARRADNRSAPLASSHSVRLSTISRFLARELDETRIVEFLWGLLACDVVHARPARILQHGMDASASWPLPREYALLKLLVIGVGSSIPSPAVKPAACSAVTSLLSAGRTAEACQIACRALRAAGFSPFPHAMLGRAVRDAEWADADSGTHDGVRIAAALLLPISHADGSALRRLVLRPAKTLQA